MNRDREIVEALLRPSAWPWPVERVRLVETHISRVLIGGDHAVKLKRPVRYSFVDYSTLERRYQACLDEVRLNRLLSDDIYQGVVPILQDGDGYRIGEVDEGGEAVDWAVLMRRIDDADLLSERLRSGDVPDALADLLADRLVPFHQQRPAWGDDDPDAALGVLADVLIENLDELHPFADDPLPSGELDLVDREVRRFIEERHDLLRERVARGWVREGHGDLRCEHVVVERGRVQIVDCTEFNVDLRRADVASDLAFLLMDLHRLGAPDEVTRRLVDRYRDAGIDLPPSLLRLYWIHRALVRAKVLCLRLPDVSGDERKAIAWRAVDYLHVATRQATVTHPAMIAMTGLSGTGKSTLARVIARMTGATLLDTDIIRKDAAYLGGDLARARGEDIYTPEWTRRTYDRMIREGAASVGEGRAAILDGTFLDPELREQAAGAARAAGVPFILLEVTCDDAVARQRVEARFRDPGRISDADVEIYLRQRERFRADPPGVPDGTVHLVVDSTSGGPELLDDTLRALIGADVVTPGIPEDGEL